MERHRYNKTKIEAAAAGLCSTGMWENPVCFLLAVFTTSLYSRHKIAALATGCLFLLAAVLRLTLSVRRSWFDASGEHVWQRWADVVVLFTGVGWGSLVGFLFYRDGYHDPDAMVLLTYLFAISAVSVRLLMLNARLIQLFLLLAYGPVVLMQVTFPHGNGWPPLLGFVLYALFLALNGKRANRQILSQLQYNEALTRIARVDFLTGLANRFWFGQLLDEQLRGATANKHRLALLFIDLNGFKKINGCFSHETGDRFLVETARTPVCIDNVLLSGGASIGISFYPDDALNAQDLLRSADRAMYAAKKGGTCRFYFADELCEGNGNTSPTCVEAVCQQAGEWNASLAGLAQLVGTHSGSTQSASTQSANQGKVVEI